MLQQILFVFLLAYASLGVSCSKDPYRLSLSGSAKVSDAVHAAVEATTQYYSTGKINDAEKATVAGYLNTVTDANMNFRHQVVLLHSTGKPVVKSDYIALAQAFVNAVPTDPLAFQYKSADAQREFATVLGAVKTALNLISATIQQAKGA